MPGCRPTLATATLSWGERCTAISGSGTPLEKAGILEPMCPVSMSSARPRSGDFICVPLALNRLKERRQARLPELGVTPRVTHSREAHLRGGLGLTLLPTAPIAASGTVNVGRPCSYCPWWRGKTLGPDSFIVVDRSRQISSTKPSLSQISTT